MPPVSARRKAAYAVLSAVAGSGLTAAGLAGPLAQDAYAGHAKRDRGGVDASQAAASGEEVGGQATTPTSTTPTPTPAEATTTSTPTSTPATEPTPETTIVPVTEAPHVVVQHRQKPSGSKRKNPAVSSTGEKTKAKGKNNVSGAPNTLANGALAAILASSQASEQALAFYRIPLFLLPIYKAAAVQYGVPWQILAAINEIETDYGADQAVSSAGAVGWMQFMPATWLQYGVDALNAGYADPYNPVDAVFAAARYLRAAGAQKDLRGAILAYNHSEEYADSVLLRAKLISTYPKPVIATLTGLVDGHLPVTGHQLSWGKLVDAYPASTSATAHASAVPSEAVEPGSASPAEGEGASGEQQDATTSASGTQTATSTAADAQGEAGTKPAKQSKPLQVVELATASDASVVAVQDGRVVAIGDSPLLGKYVILRDVYGDLFTYAGMGSIAPTYTLAKNPSAAAGSAAVRAAGTHDPAPSAPATAGSQLPVTLTVKAPKQNSPAAGGQALIPTDTNEEAPAGMNKKRLFARTSHNPDARASEALAAARRRAREAALEHQPLRRGSVVAAGTVLGRVDVAVGAHSGKLKFAIRPSGDTGTIDPGAVLANWAQLQAALHPKGAKSANTLLGATASDVLLQSRSQLERAVLADPGITLSRSVRESVALHHVDRRVLAVLAFLSRSGLKPTVATLRSEPSKPAAGAPPTSGPGTSIDITAINGTPIAGHQGQGTLTDLAIRTLLTLPSEFAPHEILSLMRYPDTRHTTAKAEYWDHVRLVFSAPAAKTSQVAPAVGRAAHSATRGATAPVPHVTTSTLSTLQWDQLMSRVAGISEPKIVFKPSKAAVSDPTAPAAKQK
ncbi:MAG TPA: lytic murein transglycosylase [Solirubrobacteraceae bacterium]|jgi:soluble lytic murein transglycosylase-like protein|nr:lytic murein transglycosylase [Solirubrobacteraceae bacterium]